MSEAALETKITEVDKQIAAAKANKAKRVTDPEREAQKAAAAAEREAKKAERQAERDRKAAERANRQVHMAKVDRAAQQLPTLSNDASRLFNEITANLSQNDVASLAAHLNHFNRVHATQSSATATLSEGMTVVITGGDPKYIGKTGTVSKAQRIRCYVDIGGEKPVYLYSAHVRIVESESIAQAV